MIASLARLSLAALAVLAALAPPAFAKNDIFPTSWGGFEFSDSDRDLQAAADTLGLTLAPDGQAVATIGQADGRLFAYRFDSSGRQVVRFRVASGSVAIALAGDGSAYVGARGGTVRRYGPTGALQGSFSTGGAPAALAVDSGGSLYAAGGSTVRRFSATGAQTGTFGGPGDVGKAVGVAVDAGGDVLVADQARERVEVFDPSGALTRTIGGPEAAAGGLTAQLAGAGVDGAGNVFVADAGGSGFDLKLFAPDGHFVQVVDRGFFAEESRPFEPLLLAVAPQGDVYFTPYNPDVQKLPAALVPAPRFRIEDRSRAASDYDLRPIAVSVGRTYRLTARVYPSLATGQQASVSLPAGLELAPGSTASVPVGVAAGSAPTDVVWPVKVTAPGRHAATVTVAGTAPSGQPTSLSKTQPIYGAVGPKVRVRGAVFLPRSRTLFVAAQLDIGRFPIAPADSFDLTDWVSNSQIDLSARAGGRGLGAQPFSIGGPLDGECQPFTVPRGKSGLRAVQVKASFAALGRLSAARVTRTVRPALRSRDPVLKACIVTSGLAGGPTH
jgi:hypothetical protein